MKVLITGSAGMIGSQLSNFLLNEGYEIIGIDKKIVSYQGSYSHFAIDLSDVEEMSKFFITNKIDRIIHLAALAHTVKGKKYNKQLYEHINVDCSKNLFDLANKYEIPVLFISTVDVYGFQKGIVNDKTICKPISIYAKTKYKAEQYLANTCSKYSIYRFSPVYTEFVKRDIQKRYYLKYPKIGYLIGKGSFFEVLDINNAVKKMAQWCKTEPNNEIEIIKDDSLLDTCKELKIEREKGNAKIILRFPRLLVKLMYYIFRITGKNKYTYLLNKAINPLRSE